MKYEIIERNARGAVLFGWLTADPEEAKEILWKNALLHPDRNYTLDTVKD